MVERKFVAPDGILETHSEVSYRSDANEFGNSRTFAGLTQEGRVLVFTPGSDTSRGGDISAVKDYLSSDVVQIFSNSRGFAAQKSDNTIVYWGGYGNGVRSYDKDRTVAKIISSGSAFLALLDDGSIDVWGNGAAGGRLPDELVGVKGIRKVVSIGWGFAALLADGEVVSWGSTPYASDPASNPDFTPGDTKVVDLVSSRGSFAGLRDDGTVVHWAGSVFNNDSSQKHQHHLANVFDWNGPDDNLRAEKIYTGNYGISVVRSDSSIASFARETGNGLIDIDNSGLKIDKMIGGEKTFAAIRSDGSVIAWGVYMPGSTVFYDGYPVSGGVVNLDIGSPPVRKPVDIVYSGSQYLNAYAVLFDDGTVQSFGHYKAGGGSLDSYNLNGINGDLKIISLKGGGNQFSVLRSDGSAVTWGEGAPSITPEILSSGVAKLYSASLALLEDGSFVSFYRSRSGDVVNHIKPESPLIALADPLSDERLIIPGPIENQGSQAILKDKEGYLWVKDSNDNYDDITVKNKPIKSSFKGWTILAAEKIDNVNKIVLKDKNGRVRLSIFDEDWNRLSRGKRIKKGTNDFATTEEQFQVDLDGDGELGRFYTTIESKGDIELQVDSYGYGRVVLGNGDIHELKRRGKHFRLKRNRGWTMKAADVVDGENKLILKHRSGKISEWSLDNSWNYIKRKSHRLGSSTISSLETSFDIDLDGNSPIGIPDSFYQTIEDLGSVKLEKDVINYGYWVTLSDGIKKPINYRGRQLTSMRLRGLKPIHAEIVDGQNKVCLSKGRNVFVEWSFDNDWNYQSRDRFKKGSSEFLEAETRYDYDLDGDGYIGMQYESIESKGDIHLKIDSLNKAWVEYPDGNLVPVLAKGRQIRQRKSFSSFLAAESFDDSINKLIMTKTTGDLDEWTLDANWNRLSRKRVRLKSDEFYELEELFDMDFNRDSITGRNWKVIDNMGSEKLLVDQDSGYGWVQSSDGSIVDIRNRGRRVKASNRGWHMHLAEKVDDENKLVFYNDKDGDIIEWTLDSDWDLESRSLHDYRTTSYYELENFLQADFDGNGIIGG